MEDLACPRCKTTKYRNPSLKLLVNVCGHALCENCVDLLFVKGSASCTQCNIPLRRTNFRLQIFEDSSVEKEVDIRRKIIRDFNKREEDFPTLRAYNDYLEEVETIIFNLVNDVDVEATKRKIETYKKENKAQIIKNKSKLGKEDLYLEDLLEQEKEESEMRKLQLQEEDLELKKERIKRKESLIDDLMFSDLPANQILASHTSIQQSKDLPKPLSSKLKVPKFSTGIKYQQQETFLPVPKANEGPLYRYSEVHVDLCGPDVPAFEELVPKGYVAHVRSTADCEKAGGFLSSVACYRALQDAFCGLYFEPEPDASKFSRDSE